MNQTCSQCSAVAPSGSAFCGACGAQLSGEPSTAPPSRHQPEQSAAAWPAPNSDPNLSSGPNPNPGQTPNPGPNPNPGQTSSPGPNPNPGPNPGVADAGSETSAGPTSVTVSLPPAFSGFHRYVVGDRAVPEPPVLLWLAVGLLGLAGLLVVLPSLWAFPDAFRLLDQGEFGRALGQFVIVLLLLMIAFGAACFYLAVKLLQADRAGRILTIVLVASMGFGLLLGAELDTSVVLAILGCAGVLAILTMVDEVRDYFTGPHAAQSGISTSVVAARSLVTALGWVLGATGLGFVPLGNVSGRLVVIGLVMICGAVVAIKFSEDLLTGDENARFIVTGLMAVYVVAILAAEPEGAGLFVPIALAGSVVGLLWGPEDAREHFGGASTVQSSS